MDNALFRGKSKSTGEWVYGDLIHYSDNDLRILEQNIRCWDILERGIEIIPETVGQYTGLKDRKGEKIFDGDIIGVITERKDITPIPMILYIETVCWNKEEAYWGTDGGNGLEKSFTENEVEVIGNIHDNPELLKK